MRPVRIFVSVAAADADLFKKLEKHLQNLEAGEQVRLFHPGRLAVGEPVDERMAEELLAADAVIFAASAAFLNDARCKEHVRLAMEKLSLLGAVRFRVIPVLLKPADFSSAPFGHLQPLPKGGIPISESPSREQACSEVAVAVKKNIDTLVLAPPPSGKDGAALRMPVKAGACRWPTSGPVHDVLAGIDANLKAMFGAHCAFAMTALMEDTMLGRVPSRVRAPDWRVIAYRNLLDPIPSHGYAYPHESRAHFADLGAAEKWFPSETVNYPLEGPGGIWKLRAQGASVPADWEFWRRENVRFALRLTQWREVSEGRGAWVVLFVNFVGPKAQDEALLQRVRQVLRDVVCTPDAYLSTAAPSFDDLVTAAVDEERARVERGEDVRFAAVLPAFIGVTEGIYQTAFSANARGLPHAPEGTLKLADRALRQVLSAALSLVTEVLRTSARERLGRDVQMCSNIRCRTILPRQDPSHVAECIADYSSTGATPFVSLLRLPFAPRNGEPMVGGITPWVLDHGRTIFAPRFDAAIDPAAPEREAVALYRQFILCDALRPTRAGIAVPIVLARGELWGAVNIEASEAGSFLPEDVRFLHVCARAIGGVVDDHLRRLREEWQRIFLEGLAESLTSRRPAVALHAHILPLIHRIVAANEVCVVPVDEQLVGIDKPIWHEDPPMSGATPQAEGHRIRKYGLCTLFARLHAGKRPPRTGLWVNAGPDGMFKAEDVAGFRLDGFDQEPFPSGSEDKGSRKRHFPILPSLLDENVEKGSSLYLLNERDKGMETLVGLPVITGVRASHNARPAASLRAILWIKNRGWIPFEPLRAGRMAELATLLGLYLTPYVKPPPGA